VTVAVRSGTRGHSVTATVPAGAKIRLNDAATSLSGLPIGGAVTVVGTRTGDVLTATKVVVHRAAH
jgi:hypothetical protein